MISATTMQISFPCLWIHKRFFLSLFRGSRSQRRSHMRLRARGGAARRVTACSYCVSTLSSASVLFSRALYVGAHCMHAARLPVPHACMPLESAPPFAASLFSFPRRVAVLFHSSSSIIGTFFFSAPLSPPTKTHKPRSSWPTLSSVFSASY